MADLRIAQDILSISELKTNTAYVVARARERPIVITQSGKAAAVIMSAAEYDLLTFQSRLHAALDKADVEMTAGRGRKHSTVRKELLGRAAMLAGSPERKARALKPR